MIVMYVFNYIYNQQLMKGRWITKKAKRNVWKGLEKGKGRGE